jgi:hypothetical protein
MSRCVCPDFVMVDERPPCVGKVKLVESQHSKYLLRRGRQTLGAKAFLIHSRKNLRI